MRSRLRTATIVTAVVVVLIQLTQSAFAGFSARAQSAPLGVSAGSIAAPASTSATAGCALLVPRVNLSWTASASTFTTGYRIFRSIGATGLFTQVGAVSGRTTLAYTDTTVVGGTTYSYVVRSVYENWTAAGPQAAVAVPVLCL